MAEKELGVGWRDDGFAVRCYDYAAVFAADCERLQEAEAEELLARAAFGVAVAQIPGGGCRVSATVRKQVTRGGTFERRSGNGVFRVIRDHGGVAAGRLVAVFAFCVIVGVFADHCYSDFWWWGWWRGGELCGADIITTV